MLEQFLAAFALMLVFEGILPFLCPECWKKLLRSFVLRQDHSVRFYGLLSMILGVSLLYIIHSVS